MTDDRGRRPAKIGDVLASVLDRAGLTERIEQAQVFPEWGSLVGAHLAAVTEPVALRRDGTLVVAVATSAWMQELTLMEPQLLRSINRVPGRPAVARLRWVLKRES
jgi:predicted nucleic acid-binding Zn ribbon protein